MQAQKNKVYFQQKARVNANVRLVVLHLSTVNHFIKSQVSQAHVSQSSISYWKSSTEWSEARFVLYLITSVSRKSKQSTHESVTRCVTRC